MAQQAGPFYLTGCFGNICFYRMEGKYYARMKSSLEGKRVKKDPVFSKTMHYAGLLGRASKIASAVYKALSKEEKVHTPYRKLTGMAMLLLKKGKTEEEVLSDLKKNYPRKKAAVVSPEIIFEVKDNFAEEVLCRVFAYPFVYDKGEVFCKYEALPP